MARFDVYAGLGNADLLRDLNTRFVVPLMLLENAPQPARRLNPVFEIDGRDYAMVTQFAAAVARRDCGVAVASLAHQHSMIIGATDVRITGY